MKKLLLGFLVLINSFCFSQKIDKSKKELTAGAAAPRATTVQSSNSGSSKSSNRSTLSDVAGDAFFEVAGIILFGVFKYGLIGDYQNEDHLHNNLSAHPFIKNKIGNYISDDSTSIARFRVDLKNNFLYNTNNFIGNHFEAKIRPNKYLYIQLNHRQLIENIAFTKTNSQLTIMQFNLGYDRIRFENFNLGYTIGLTHVGSGVNISGFSYGLNTEYFFDEKISLLADKKWSTINNQPVNSFKLEGKYHQKNYFLSMGFEHLKIATPTYNFIALGAGFTY